MAALRRCTAWTLCALLLTLALTANLFLTALDTRVYAGESAPLFPTAVESARALESEPPDLETITLNFVGDVMAASLFGNSYWGSFNLFAKETDPSYFFAEMADLFQNDDLTVANCENVFTDRDLHGVGKNYTPAYWYKAPTSFVEILRLGGIEAVSIANNHIYDYGTDGREDTIAALEERGLLWGDDTHTMYFEKYGVRLAFLCTTITSGGYTEVWDKLEAAKSESDFQIVCFHGGVERTYDIDPIIEKVCHDLVFAGADLIIGHHPHVLKPIDVYYGVKIVYSLGNFLFGGGLGDAETAVYQLELLVSGGQILEANDRVIPARCYTAEHKWQPALETDPEKAQRIIEFLYMVRETPK